MPVIDEHSRLFSFRRPFRDGAGRSIAADDDFIRHAIIGGPRVSSFSHFAVDPIDRLAVISINVVS